MFIPVILTVKILMTLERNNSTVRIIYGEMETEIAIIGIIAKF